MPLIFIYYVKYKTSSISSDFWDFAFGIIKENRSTCLSKWLLISAIADKNPDRLVRLYPTLQILAPNMTLSNQSGIAIIESAIWLKDQDIAKSIIDAQKILMPHLRSQSAKWLEFLYLWRFYRETKSERDLSLMISAATPHESFLPYVDYLARANVADSLDKINDALLYYQKALKTIPQDSIEYKYIIERCNDILSQ